MESFIQKYETFLGTEDIKTFGKIMGIYAEKEKQAMAEAKKRFLETCPYRVELATFTKKECKTFNIDDRNEYYRITDDKGNVLFGGSLFALGLKSNPIEFLKTIVKSGRYLVLPTYTVEKYSESVVKHCKLKSALHLQMHNCVVDKERGEIVYTTEKYISDYISVYENILVDEKNRVWYLPDSKLIFTNGVVIAQTEKNVLWSEQKYWTGNIEVYCISKSTGEISKIE